MPELTPVMSRFVLHWGEMGSRWGVNRTVAQIHALLMICEEPLNAEDISETLKVSRSNVSTSLRELVSWGIVHPIQKLGDRRDYYEAVGDVWEMARLIADSRKRREFDPTVETLRSLVLEIKEEGKKGQEYQSVRLNEMLEFLETFGRFYEQIQRIPTPHLKRFVRLGEKLPKVIRGKSK